MIATADEIVVASGITDSDLASLAENVTLRRMPRLLEVVVGDGVQAMTLGTTILVRSDRLDEVLRGDGAELLAHELVHARQWRDYGKVRFLAMYLSDYTRLRLLGLTHPQAYRGIGFEHEAFKESEHMVEIV